MEYGGKSFEIFKLNGELFWKIKTSLAKKYPWKEKSIIVLVKQLKEKTNKNMDEIEKKMNKEVYTKTGNGDSTVTDFED